MFNLTRFERYLWAVSVIVVLAGSLCSSERNYLNILASLIGVSALIFLAKGNVMGQVLTVVFSLLYGWISYRFQYYGEMITYLCMTMPIAILSIISWLRNPYDGENKTSSASEVKIARMTHKKVALLVGATIVVTVVFYFILGAFGTQNLIVSTISVATSFLASSLMYFRSPGYALAYAANDIVLIVLWILASVEKLSYVTMVLCFVIFLCNDIYGYYNWKRMRDRQSN